MTPRLAAVIGDPVGHSLSPAIHNAAFEALGLDWVYVAFEVRPADLAAAIAGVRALGIGGLSVTMPHKTAIVTLLDGLSPVAESLGAVNTVVRDGDRLIGHNTDGTGVIGALAAAGFDPAGKHCLVLGAGGAARAAVYALAHADAGRVAVWARRPEAARAAAALGGRAGSTGPADATGFDLVVNATPLGMRPDDPPPLDPAPLGPSHTVLDLVYAQVETPLLAAARSGGSSVINGLAPLVHQAAAAFTLWTGIPAPLDLMADTVSTSQESVKMDR